MKRSLRVGVTLAVRESAQSIWENGIFQNCAFLVQSLRHSPLVGQAVLLTNRPQVPRLSPDLLLQSSGLALMGLDEALQALDVVIEMSAQLDTEWVQAFGLRGGRLVSMYVGNTYVIDVERALFAQPPAGLWDRRRRDAVWTLPQYRRSCRAYLEVNTRCPVRELPHLWSPFFVQQACAGLAAGARFGYAPGRARWRLCGFEPNLCMVKTALIPLLAGELAYRQRPGSIEALRLCNALAWREHEGIAALVRGLDVVRDGVARFEPRYATYELMAHHGDCVISHQWENEQNYLHYELLWGGYPLVHNCEPLRELGYYYQGFDCHGAAAALLRALDEHDAGLAEHRRRAAAWLRGLDPGDARNVACYTAELQRLVAGGG